MADEYDDLYGDLYPGEAEYGSAATSAAPAPAASTQQPASTASTAAQSSSAIPSYSDAPSASTGSAGLPAPPLAAAAAAVNNPPPIHFAPNYAAQRTSEGRTAGVRPADMPEEGKMFIGGLNWDTTDDSLKMYFEQFGRITNCTIMRDSETGRSRGFGFLTFEDPASVNAVMAREHHLDGKTIDPKRAIPRSDTAKTDKLFVRALPQTCTQESFRSYWRQFGPITDATLMMDKETGRHRGFGFVNYETREAVEKVLQSGPHYMDGQMLEVKRAQAKGEPRRDFNQNTNQPYMPQPNMSGGMGMNAGAGGVGGGMGMGGGAGAGNMGMGMGGGMNAGGMGGAASPFDPAAMSKFFASMGWGAWNPLMMGQQQMPGFGGAGAFNPMMGGMGGFGMGGMGGMGNMGMGGMGMGGSPMGAMSGGDNAGAADGSSSGAGQGDASSLSSFTGPMAGGATSMRGGRGGAMGGAGAMRGGRGGGRAGFNPPTGPASMRHDEGGAGPQRNRGSGAGFHPYSR
ncbi:RNA-binding protein [Rhodotorula paludigena]|uniref:RNA-binding protein n=1 Tax=Rhodotorula paludigena TaxID=86838 RepID=UPI003177C404